MKYPVQTVVATGKPNWEATIARTDVGWRADATTYRTATTDYRKSMLAIDVDKAVALAAVANWIATYRRDEEYIHHDLVPFMPAAEAASGGGA